MAKKEIIVSQDGTGDYSTISEAIENAEAGTKIYVKPGTYEEYLEINKKIELVGDKNDYPVVSVESGNVCTITDDASIGYMHFKNSNQGDCENIALVKTNSNCKLFYCKLSNSVEDGLTVIEEANPTVENCEIFQCQGVGFVIYDDSNPRVKNCEVYDNENGGIYITCSATGTYSGCNLYGNGGDDCNPGMGVGSSANPTVENCEIHDNEGDGICVLENATGTYRNCKLYNNGGSNISDSSSDSSQFENNEED